MIKSTANQNAEHNPLLEKKKRCKIPPKIHQITSLRKMKCKIAREQCPLENWMIVKQSLHALKNRITKSIIN